MAACGLETSRRTTANSEISSNKQEKNYNEVKVMVKFAIEMNHVLNNMKIQSAKPYK